MNIGTSLHALTEFGNDIKPFHDNLDDLGELGFRSLMLLDRPGQPPLTAGERPTQSLLDFGASDPAVVREALESRGLSAAAVHRGCMAVATEVQAAVSADALAHALRLADRLGAAIAIPNGGGSPAPGTPTAEKEELIRRVAEVMTTALAAAAPGQRLAIDIHYGAAIETVADCLRLFDLAPDPRVGVTLNIGHMTTNRQEGWRLIEQHPERIHVIAWKDHLLTPPPEAPHPVWSVELGTGDSPFERYVTALRQHPVEAFHLITFENLPLGEKKGALGRSLAYLRELWRSSPAVT